MIDYTDTISTRLDGMSKTYYHRAGIRYCPHCKFEGDDHVWYYEENVIEVAFNHPWRCRNGCIVISSCPKCKELSWIHYEIDFLIEVVKNIVALDGKKSVDLNILHKYDETKEGKTCY